MSHSTTKKWSLLPRDEVVKALERWGPRHIPLIRAKWWGEHRLHWWLHSCGNNTDILEDLIEVGLHVFHPVQKGTMDETSVAAQSGDRLTFLVGIDVQRVLQERDPAGVRKRSAS